MDLINLFGLLTWAKDSFEVGTEKQKIGKTVI